jgi:two-component system chemotaxis response regulator CheB
MRSRYVVVIGASAGGLDALRTVVAALPPTFPAAICVVLHTSPQSPGVLDEILGRAGALPAIKVGARAALEPGKIYVAPPDCHLVVEPGRVHATKGPRENRFRPAIDPLFRSAAQVYGPAAVGVILTGNLDDGTAGLLAIKQLGGVAVVQDPHDALFPSMPLSALRYVAVDHRVPLAAIAALLVKLTTSPPAETGGGPVPENLDIEVKIAKAEHPLDAGLERIGEPSRFACPECHGVLLQLKGDGLLRFRCHTGHAYSTESLLADVSEGVDEALWNAIRSLEEASLLLQRLSEQMGTTGARDQAQRLIDRAGEARRHSDVIRRLATEREPLGVNDTAVAASTPDE